MRDARQPESLRQKLDRDGDKDLSESLVVLALVPGNPFVGAEEGRRRTRYAILAGLQAQDYVPDNAERIGLLEFDIKQLSDAGVADPSKLEKPEKIEKTDKVEKTTDVTPTMAKFVVPFEMLSERRLLRDNESTDPPPQKRRYEQVVTACEAKALWMTIA